MSDYRPQLPDIQRAKQRISAVVENTPLALNLPLSARYGAHIWLKREDLQIVRSYKIRGAYNKRAGLSEEERARGVVCASAGNHAQGVALAARRLGCRAVIVMPVTAPALKVEAVRNLGGEVVLDWGGGLIWALLPEGTDARARAAPYTGHATCLRGRAPRAEPEAPAVAALSRALQARFDPRGILDPERAG